jgi:hypothetical protein
MLMAFNQPVTQNSTSNIVELTAFDSATGKYKTGLVHNTSGLVVETSLNGAAWASIGTLVTMTEGTWTSLGFKESSSPGIYQVGTPNANWTTTGQRKFRIRVTSDDTVVGPAESVAITGASVYAATVDAVVTSIANNAITAAAIASDAATEIANAGVEAQITALKTYNRSANTTATIDGPVSGSNSLGVAVDASYDPIKTF